MGRWNSCHHNERMHLKIE